MTHAGHPIQLFVRASHEQEAWMNVRYRVELSQTERSVGRAYPEPAALREPQIKES